MCQALKLDRKKDSSMVIVPIEDHSFLLIKDAKAAEILKPSLTLPFYLMPVIYF